MIQRFGLDPASWTVGYIFAHLYLVDRGVRDIAFLDESPLPVEDTFRAAQDILKAYSTGPTHNRVAITRSLNGVLLYDKAHTKEWVRAAKRLLSDREKTDNDFKEIGELLGYDYEVIQEYLLKRKEPSDNCCPCCK